MKIRIMCMVFFSVVLFTLQIQAAPNLDGKPASVEARTNANANAWLEIDPAAFEHNIKTVQAKLGKNTQMCAVMKADAYGHGISLLMPTILKLGVPCVGVTSNDELRLVRELGFNGRLARIRSASPEEIEAALPYNAEELVGSLEVAEAIGIIAKRNGKVLPVHIGLNSSGMSRNGIDLSTDEGKKNAVAIAQNPNVKVVAIMTHYPVGKKAEVLKALAAFKDESAWLIKAAGLKREDITLHTANTFATLEVPESHLDMVRPGRVLYGDMGPEDTIFKKVLSGFKTKVASVNFYPKGSAIGYDGTYVLARDSMLANIPVGYSDGYSRFFSNKAHVLINEQRAPVVGRISMNTFMVDVTDLKKTAKPGDEVVLYGKQGSAEVTQEELEELYNDFLANQYTIWAHSNYKLLKQ